MSLQKKDELQELAPYLKKQLRTLSLKIKGKRMLLACFVFLHLLPVTIGLDGG